MFNMCMVSLYLYLVDRSASNVKSHCSEILRIIFNTFKLLNSLKTVKMFNVWSVRIYLCWTEVIPKLRTTVLKSLELYLLLLKNCFLSENARKQIKVEM